MKTGQWSVAGLLWVAAGLLLTGIFGETMARAGEWKSFKIGDMEVTALADRPVDTTMPNRPELLINPSAGAKALLTPGSMANSVNCFVVKIAGETLLFDTGLGGANGGQLQAALAAAKVKPEDVNAVIITHFHPDHIGGLLKGPEEAAFPNARLMVGRIEVEANPKAAMQFMTAYAGRLHTFEWEHYVANGVVALAAPGHTKGHTVFLLDDGKAKLLIAGDLIHFQNIQLPFPETAVTYDTDPAQAVKARKDWFDKAAAEGYVVAGMHLRFPGIGVLAKSGNGYTLMEK